MPDRITLTNGGFNPAGPDGPHTPHTRTQAADLTSAARARARAAPRAAPPEQEEKERRRRRAPSWLHLSRTLAPSAAPLRISTANASSPRRRLCCVRCPLRHGRCSSRHGNCARSAVVRSPSPLRTDPVRLLLSLPAAVAVPAAASIPTQCRLSRSSSVTKSRHRAAIRGPRSCKGGQIHDRSSEGDWICHVQVHAFSFLGVSVF